MLCQLKCCTRCKGDLVLDGDEWRCWQCGRYFYPDTPDLQPPPEEAAAEAAEEELGLVVARRQRRPRWAVGDINSLIVAKHRSEQRWWIRNQELIKYLDEGRTVREISTLVGRSERQVRVVREQLNDLRAEQNSQALVA
ncbi:MAG: hypothetical protein FJ316_12910 [SAR202 cluster bacterium]|nr:hypothetical protein [SAR202 cluster bacterium]